LNFEELLEELLCVCLYPRVMNLWCEAKKEAKEGREDGKKGNGKMGGWESGKMG
jgi:hypothetical protein